MKTIKNKMAALALFAVGFLPIIPSIILGENEIDCTYMIFISVLCICLFFSKESWSYCDEPSEEVWEESEDDS